MTRQIDPKRPPTHTAGNEHYRRAERILGNGPGETLALQAIGHALLALATPPEPALATTPTDEPVSAIRNPADLIANGRHITRRLIEANMTNTAAVVAQLADYVTAHTEDERPEPANRAAFARHIATTVDTARTVARELRGDGPPPHTEEAADLLDELCDLIGASASKIVTANKGVDWTGSAADIQRFAEYLRTSKDVGKVDTPQVGESVVVDGAHYRVHPDDRGYSPSTVERRTHARTVLDEARQHLDARPGLRSVSEALLERLVAAIDGLLA